MKPVIIALTGKGGVGKTSVSAMMVRILTQRYPDKKILAIDADPAVGLACALGVDVQSTVDDIRTAFIETVENDETQSALEMLSEARYRMVDALVEKDNLSFLAIGRPEGAGCYCKVNAYLKEIISRIAYNFDYVVIDGEAGIEQVNRRVMEKVTHLVLVSDASKKGLSVVDTIHKVAENMILFEKAGLIINRIPDMSMADLLDTHGLDVLAKIPDDRNMSLADMQGISVFGIDTDSEIYRGTVHALERLSILNEENNTL